MSGLTSRERRSRQEALRGTGKKWTREEYVYELEMRRMSQTATQFDNAFYNYLDQHPDCSLADAWDEVEGSIARAAGRRTGFNPFRYD